MKMRKLIVMLSMVFTIGRMPGYFGESEIQKREQEALSQQIKFKQNPWKESDFFSRTNFHKGPGYAVKVFPWHTEPSKGFEKVKSIPEGYKAAKKEISYKNEKYSGAYEGYEGINKADQQKKLSIRLASRFPNELRNTNLPLKNLWLSDEEIEFYEKNKQEIENQKLAENDFRKKIAAKYKNPTNLDRLLNWLQSWWPSSSNTTNPKSISIPSSQQFPTPTNYPISSSKPDSTRE